MEKESKVKRDEFVTDTGYILSVPKGPNMGFLQWIAARRHHYLRLQHGMSRLDKYGEVGAQVNSDMAFYVAAENAYFEYLESMDFAPIRTHEDENPAPLQRRRVLWAWLIRYLSGIKAALLAV